MFIGLIQTKALIIKKKKKIETWESCMVVSTSSVTLYFFWH